MVEAHNHVPAGPRIKKDGTMSKPADPRLFALRLTGVFLVATILTACATVKVEPPSKPIEINLNVKIEGELRVRLDREIETLINENPDIF